MLYIASGQLRVILLIKDIINTIHNEAKTKSQAAKTHPFGWLILRGIEATSINDNEKVCRNNAINKAIITVVSDLIFELTKETILKGRNIKKPKLIINSSFPPWLTKYFTGSTSDLSSEKKKRLPIFLNNKLNIV